MNTTLALTLAVLLKASFPPLSFNSISLRGFWKQIITSQRVRLVMSSGDAAGIFGDLRTNLVNVEERVATISRRLCYWLCYLMVSGKYGEATILSSVMSDEERRPLKCTTSAIIPEEGNLFFKGKSGGL